MSKLQTTINKDTNEMTMTRVIAAPRQKVWEAYTKPELLEKWWGPRIFKTTVKELDLKPGGRWLYIMTGTEGEWKDVDACGLGVYEEIKEPELLVYKDMFADKEGNVLPDMPVAQVTINFTENDGKTTINSITKYANAEAMQKVIDMGVEDGFGETLDRLEELLAQ